MNRNYVVTIAKKYDPLGQKITIRWYPTRRELTFLSCGEMVHEKWIFWRMVN